MTELEIKIRRILCNVPNEMFLKRLMDIYDELAEILAKELDEKKPL